jgi:transposase
MRFVPVVRVDDDQKGLADQAVVKRLAVRVEISGACAVIEGSIDERALCMVFKALRASA